MHPPPSPPHDKDVSIAAQALRWQLRKLDHGSWTPAAEAALQEWLAASPEHAREFSRNAHVVAQMSREDVYAPGVITAARHRHAAADGSRRQFLRHWAAGGLALAAVAVLFFGLSFWLSPWQEIFATQVAERRQVTLPDGTEVELDAATRLSCEFGRSRRQVVLESGTATFRVTPDKRRPFEVLVDGRVVQVVGTYFEVARRTAVPGAVGERAVHVALAEGVVDLYSVDENGVREKIQRLHPGEQARWTRRAARPEVTEFPEGAFATWHKGRFFYRAETLANVLADLQRAFPVSIELRDASLGEVSLSGSFSASNLDETCALLESILPLKIEKNDTGGIVVRSRDEE